LLVIRDGVALVGDVNVGAVRTGDIQAPTPPHRLGGVTRHPSRQDVRPAHEIGSWDGHASDGNPGIRVDVIERPDIRSIEPDIDVVIRVRANNGRARRASRLEVTRDPHPEQAQERPKAQIRMCPRIHTREQNTPPS
jgi:hypothetical protein